MNDIEIGLQRNFMAVLETYCEHETDDERVRDEMDFRILQQANVIGVPTSGLAGKLDRLRRV